MVEELLTAEDVNITDLLMNGLAMFLNYTGNTAYISSALENCEANVAANNIIVYDKLWVLVHKYKKNASPQELERINQAMTIFFTKLTDRDVPLTERITILTRLYQLLCVIYTVGIINNISWASEK